jgi:hypothetical protein
MCSMARPGARRLARIAGPGRGQIDA